MRYTELITNKNTTEARSWTDADDIKLLHDQIKSEDNIRAFYSYAQDVHLTNAVKLLALRPDCKWFFNFLTKQLHVMDANGVYPLTFYMRKHGEEFHVWARDDRGEIYSYPIKPSGTFPLDSIKLRAVYEGNFWHVSFGKARAS
jgi:hypothetical protein